MNRVIRLITGSMVALALLVGMAGVSGCNTMEGAGKDIKKAGDKIEDAAD